MTSEFDQDSYWIARHEQLRGDPRSVGNFGKSIIENLDGEMRLIGATNWIAANLKEYNSVLDIGCGYGRIAASFCDNGYQYVGIDVAPAAIEAARKREPRANFVLGSALDAPVEGKFDLICFIYVLVHFVNDDDWSAAIRRFVGHLKAGGAILIADMFPEVEENPAQHVRVRPLSKYIEELGRCGLVRDPEFKERFSKSRASAPPFELFV